MKKKKHRRLHWAVVIIAIVALTAYTLLFRSLTASTTVITISEGQTAQQVLDNIRQKSRGPQFAALKLMATILNYDEHVHPGRYKLEGPLHTMRALYGGLQSPVHLTIPSVRTLDDLAKTIAPKVGFTAKQLLEQTADSALIDSLGYNRYTLIALFTPNTYDVYYDISPRNFIIKMASETKKFWNDKRTELAQKDSLSPMQATILASIVQEETNAAEDKPIIAGLYVNRLRIGMPLQSCPTIRFALQDFTIKRIYENMLQTDSPYNTYKYRGLPPGPIRNPNPEDIDAVLNYDHNQYLYMCASAKMDGTHHFTTNYEDHKAYSEEYDKELNRRKIK